MILQQSLAMAFAEIYNSIHSIIASRRCESCLTTTRMRPSFPKSLTPSRIGGCPANGRAYDELLPTDASVRHAVLVKMVHIDLEYRLKAGEKARVETYLDRYPEVASNAALVVELAACEFSLRRRSEAEVTPEEYRQRLLQYADLIGAAFTAKIFEPSTVDDETRTLLPELQTAAE